MHARRSMDLKGDYHPDSACTRGNCGTQKQRRRSGTKGSGDKGRKWRHIFGDDWRRIVTTNRRPGALGPTIRIVCNLDGRAATKRTCKHSVCASKIPREQPQPTHHNGLNYRFLNTASLRVRTPKCMTSLPSRLPISSTVLKLDVPAGPHAFATASAKPKRPARSLASWCRCWRGIRQSSRTKQTPGVRRKPYTSCLRGRRPRRL